MSKSSFRKYTDSQAKVTLQTKSINCTTVTISSSRHKNIYSDFVMLLYMQDSGDCGDTVVKVLYYKSEGRWFDSRWCYWNFSWI